MKNISGKYIIISFISIIFVLFIGVFLYKMLSITQVYPVFGVPQEYEIESYGREKFVEQSLEFKLTGVPNKEILCTFNPKRMESYGDGVLLIFGENRKYIKGIYVDPNDFTDGEYGSGTYIVPRSKHIGWAEIKKRAIYSNVNIKAIGAAYSIYSNDYKDEQIIDPNG